VAIHRDKDDRPCLIGPKQLGYIFAFFQTSIAIIQYEDRSAKLVDMRDKTLKAVGLVLLLACDFFSGTSASARFLQGPSLLLGGDKASPVPGALHTMRLCSFLRQSYPLQLL
jgi:hypothetical protein